MVKNCNVDNCTRFTVTQWMISVTLAIMIAMQAYIVKRVDRIEENVKGVKDIINTVKTDLIEDQVMVENNEKRLSLLEHSMTRFFLREK